MVFGHTFNRVSSLLCQDTRLFRNSMPVHHEPQQCRSDTGRHPSNLCGVSINIVMYHVREGVKKNVFFWEISPKCVYPPTHPRVFVRFGRTKGEIRVEKEDFWGNLGGGFEGCGPCLGISHPTQPHLGEISQKTIFFTPSLTLIYSWVLMLPTWWGSRSCPWSQPQKGWAWGNCKGRWRRRSRRRWSWSHTSFQDPTPA